MVEGFGWWLALPKVDMLVNRASGQRLRRIGPGRVEDDPAAEGWFRFEYRDDEVGYPLICRLTESRYINPLKPCDKFSGQILQVDHNRSASLWRRERGSETEVPPYGLWRRVDDCITDAFPCWPGKGSGEPAWQQVGLRGGWLNGGWQDRLFRTFAPLTPDIRQGVERGLHTLTAETPAMAPLDEAPPSPWRFHPYPADAPPPGENCCFPLPELIRVFDLPDEAGYRVLGPRDNPGFLYTHRIAPAGQALPSIEGRAPYLRSADGARILYPRSATRDDQQFGIESFTFEYVDDDVMVTLMRARNESLEPQAAWTVDLMQMRGCARREEDRFRYRIRHFPSAPPSQWTWGNHAPTYDLWRRLSTELSSAWLSWKGSDFRAPQWSRRLALRKTASVTLRYNYLGGIWPAGEYCTARLLDEGKPSEDAPI
ncbi:MAG: hypothetical protein QNJ30_20855 [Kiloniellales bacterium]|nr:hypothetical protein [Kiloniellales bacterium]